MADDLRAPLRDPPPFGPWSLPAGSRELAEHRRAMRYVRQITAHSAITANTTLDATYGLVPVACSTANITITLPPVSADLTGLTYSIVKTDATIYKVIIEGNASELVSGELNQDLELQWEALTIRCTGTAWMAI